MDLLAVEVYGSPVLSTWFNRDLAIAGRVTVKQRSGEIEEHNVFFDGTPVIIPALAPHLDRKAHKKGLQFNTQEHLVPIFGLNEKGIDTSTFTELLRHQLTFNQLLDFDLFLVPLEKPRFIGREGDMIASYRLDNLASSHAALIAVANVKDPPEKTLPIVLFWDHEEIGSETSIGASSPFFRDFYDRICSVYRLDKEDEILMRQSSLCLSVDLTHAVNPAYEKWYDPHHLPLLGGGITLKYNANMRYTTSARTGAYVSILCDRLELNMQRFAYRSDNPAGSTVGPLFATQMGIETADIGIPQLAMHAAREVIACRDHLDMCTLLTAFVSEGA
jgi:aspartyl aminopeptidase